jgi:hypothetical protein
MVPDNFGLALIWRRKKQNQSKGAFKPGEWNSFLVRALDDRYQTFINDVPITDFEFDGVAGPGHIGLQVHGVKKPELVGKKVRFRNIYLKEVQSVEEQVEDDEAVSTTVSPPKIEPALYPYLDTSKGRAGYEFAGRGNQYLPDVRLLQTSGEISLTEGSGT